MSAASEIPMIAVGGGVGADDVGYRSELGPQCVVKIREDSRLRK